MKIFRTLGPIAARIYDLYKTEFNMPKSKGLNNVFTRSKYLSDTQDPETIIVSPLLPGGCPSDST